MFIGKYYFKLQDKGRISLPKKFRQQSDQWIVTRGLDGCLFIFKADSFQQGISTLANRSFTKQAHRDLVRIMTNEAVELTADNNGRINLPDYLIDYAQLNKKLVVVGSYNRIEVWDQDHYHRYMNQLENQAEQIAETVNVD